MGERGMTEFVDDIKKGKIGEDIFIKDFLEFLDIKYVDVTGCQRFQIIDTDYLTKIGTYEVKTNYKDDENLIFEEYTNIEKSLGKISLGWLYKSQADLFVFVSKNTRTMVFLPFNDRFKQYYPSIREQTKIIKNRPTVHNGGKWQSAFRIVPFNMLSGYISIYKKR
jgi:hypothetical protein